MMPMYDRNLVIFMLTELYRHAVEQSIDSFVEVMGLLAAADSTIAPGAGVMIAALEKHKELVLAQSGATIQVMLDVVERKVRAH